MVRATKEELGKFLKERNLTRSFNTWSSLRKNRKRIVEVVTSNYDGTQSRKRIYAIRTKYGTTFRDFKTLKSLGKSRSKLKEALTKLNSYKNIKLPADSFNGKAIENKAKINVVKLKNASSTYSYNKAEQRLREMRKTNTVMRNKVGSVGCDIEVRKGKNNFRMRVRSRFGILNNKKTREGLIDENIRLVSGKAGYTPDEIIIHEVWYEYWLDKKEKLTRIR